MDKPNDWDIATAQFDEGVDAMSEIDAKTILKQMFRTLLRVQAHQEQQLELAKKLLNC